MTAGSVRKIFIVMWAMGMLVFPLTGNSHASLINGDFSDGLNGWNTMGDMTGEGDVNVSNGVAILADNDDWWSSLYQGVELKNGNCTIQFDISFGVSSAFPDLFFGFPDTFFATLYFVDEPYGFDLDNSSSYDSVALFDVDYGEIYISNGTFSASAMGDNWASFAMDFQNDHDYVVPVFELYDNALPGDSQVMIDNVSINPVPEPATILLLGSGLLGLGGIRRRRKEKSIEVN